MRIPRWPFSRLMLAAATILLLPAAHMARAQQKPVRAPIAAPATPPTNDELISTRQELLALLRQTPTLKHVLETDPSLLADQDYVTRTNPQLEQFLTQHPEVSRNPDFYLFADLRAQHGRQVDSLRRRTDGDEPPTDEQMQADMHRRELENLTAALSFVGIGGALLWLIRMLLQSRRWSRLFRLQSEVHNKLIDRFSTNQEILHYMETEPGKRFLEAAPIPIEFEQGQRMPGGFGRVLASLQIGVVLALLGVGLLILERRLPDIAAPLLVFGMVALMPGLGFIISAIVTWRISARLGLLPLPASQQATPSTQLSDRQ